MGRQTTGTDRFFASIAEPTITPQLVTSSAVPLKYPLTRGSSVNAAGENAVNGCFPVFASTTVPTARFLSLTDVAIPAYPGAMKAAAPVAYHAIGRGIPVTLTDPLAVGVLLMCSGEAVSVAAPMIDSSVTAPLAFRITACFRLPLAGEL